MKTKDSKNLERIYIPSRTDGDKTTLIGPDHSDVNDDKMIVTQRAPSPQKVYPGARKSNLTYVLGAISKEAGVDVRRPLRVDISTSHTAGYTDDQIVEAVLRACNVYVAYADQLKTIVHKGVRPS